MSKLAILFSIILPKVSVLMLASALVFSRVCISETMPQLDIAPQICVAAKDKPCHMEIELSWKGTGNKLICILSNAPQFLSWCNNTKEVHSLRLSVDTQEDIQFVMVDKQNHQLLARVIFQVTQLKEPLSHQRYRNPWSLF